MTGREAFLLYAKLTLTAVFWGGTFIAGRVVAAGMSAPEAACLRFWIAALALLPLVRQREGGLPRLDQRQLLAVTLLGLTGIFTYNICFFQGLKLIEAGRAALIVALCPVLLALLTMGEDRLTPLRWLGVLLSVTGAMFVITRGDIRAIRQGAIGLGELCIFGSVLSWAAYTLIGRRLMSRLTPLASVTYSVIIGAAALTIPAAAAGLFAHIAAHRAREWLGLAYLSLFGTVLGFVWYYEGVQRVGSVRAGLFINLVPVCAVVIAALILGERLTAPVLAGGALVLLGVVLTNRRA
ncbi:MAG: DMT family transporter [Vicinamibacteria bacterium]|jgi:drug/metabolite transporter (DMT)-like permease|nr:DMT family transporter [Vicinamibacteria bacterium]